MPPEIAGAQSSLLFEIVTLTFSGITFVLVLGVAIKVSALLATIVTKLDFLSELPDKVNKLDTRVGKLETDVNNLWNAYRDDSRTDHK